MSVPHYETLREACYQIGVPSLPLAAPRLEDRSAILRATFCLRVGIFGHTRHYTRVRAIAYCQLTSWLAFHADQLRGAAYFLPRYKVASGSNASAIDRVNAKRA
jgi:hypothetical protein